MSVTELPEIVESGQHRRRARGVTGQRLGLCVLLIGIAVATVAVPPLIAPEPRRSAEPTAPAPVIITVPSAIATATKATPTPRPAPEPCARVAGGAPVEVSTRPSCGIYAGSLGNGWTATGAGLKVLPGETVPDTKEPAMRVERSRPALPATTLSITAARAVGIGPQTRLTLRVWGGRDYGTVLRLTSGTKPAGGVTLTAKADTWTSFTVKLGELTGADSLSRIDLAVAADQVPHVNRFFLDDIALAG